MAVKIKTRSGTIDIDNGVIPSTVGGATTGSYGVVGMVSRSPLRDGVNQVLRRENFTRGVVVRQQGDGVAVDASTVVGYDTKTSKVSKSVQAKAKCNLETMFGITVNLANVCVRGMRTLED